MTTDRPISSWHRQMTPPQSPSDQPFPELPSALTKMSLDFIVSGSQASSANHFSSSSFSGSFEATERPELMTRRASDSYRSPPSSIRSDDSDGPSSPITNPPFTLPPFSELAPELAPEGHGPPRHPRTSTLDHYPLRLHQHSSPPSSKHHPTPLRPERHPYDAEELTAIIYLRAACNLRWHEVHRCFLRIFPPNTPRRCQAAIAKGLPKFYLERNVQGLQCRWYRLREEEGLAALRKGGGGKGERSALERMSRKGEISMEFWNRLRAVGGDGAK
ncbi:hypothetical protein EJ06DRAFT_556198 [Trichodelitschia bisporula]|uniref:Uncharacterized protein n=1 Tax=Trichodelitschia bisporula TaxID=703511 RepID=A0A6G1HY53_9PEZI|nr:hypothetical protein EJ06DRAFT_556198 [Trichodelitschia bisporula]